jgi:hypothetical protein
MAALHGHPWPVRGGRAGGAAEVPLGSHAVTPPGDRHARAVGSPLWRLTMVAAPDLDGPGDPGPLAQLASRRLFSIGTGDTTDTTG